MDRLLSANNFLLEIFLNFLFFEIFEILFFVCIIIAREYVHWKVMAGLEMTES